MTRTTTAAKPELTISAPAGGTQMPDIQTTVRTSQTAAPPTVDQVQAKRERLHAATHAAQAAGAVGDQQEDTPPPPPREEIESMELQLPGEVVVMFGPPSGVALQLRIASILGRDLTEYMAIMVKTVMSIRTINGKAVPPVGNMVDVQRVANMVGEDGLDLLMLALNTYWPQVSISDLQIVKKNLRQ